MATALLATAACTSGDADDDPLDITFSDRALWRTDAYDLGEPKHTVLLGDTVLLDGAGPKGVPRTIAVDAATGQARWTLTDGEPLPGGGGAIPDHGATTRPPMVTGDRTGDDWGLLVAYVQRRPGSIMPERGLAAVSGEDGRVLWKTPLIHAGGEPRGYLTGRVVDADDALAVLSMPLDDGSPGHRVIAVDLKTRKKLWERRDLQAHAVAGDTVVARTTRDPSDPREGREKITESVLGLNPRTGETRWTQEPDGVGAGLAAATDQLTVFLQRNENGSDGEAVVLDSASGEERYRVDQVGSCEQDADGLIACLERRLGKLTVFDSDSGDRVTDGRELGEEGDHVDLDGVWNGRVAVSSDGPDAEGGESWRLLVDRDGARRADTLPGRAVALSADYAAFTVPVDPRKPEVRSNETTAIHRVSERSESRGAAEDEPATNALGPDAHLLRGGATHSVRRSGPKARAGRRRRTPAGSPAGVRSEGRALRWPGI